MEAKIVPQKSSRYGQVGNSDLNEIPITPDMRGYMSDTIRSFRIQD